MSGSPRGLWYRWKSLRLPWRSKWIVGQDLTGVTFYEHKFNPLSATKPRRSASYPRATHPGDVILTPAWLQWLRNTRVEAPSIPEQQAELQRQSNLKQLAAAADQRWNEKRSFLDKPEETGQAPAEILEPRDRGGYEQVDPRGMGTPGNRGGEGKGLRPQEESSGMKSMTGSEEETLGASRGEDVVKGRFKGPMGPTDARERDSDAAGDAGRKMAREKGKEDPWKKAKSSGEWQPQAWTPPGGERR